MIEEDKDFLKELKMWKEVFEKRIKFIDSELKEEFERGLKK